MPEYRVSYSFLYDLATIGRAASVTYNEHPNNVTDVESLGDVESDGVPTAFKNVSDAMVTEIIDDEAALAGMLAGSEGYAQDVETANEERGVVFIPVEDVKAYLLAVDDLAGNVALDNQTNARLRDAMEGVVQHLSQPLHPTDGSVVMDTDAFDALDSILSERMLQLAFGDPELDD